MNQLSMRDSKIYLKTTPDGVVKFVLHLSVCLLFLRAVFDSNLCLLIAVALGSIVFLYQCLVCKKQAFFRLVLFITVVFGYLVSFFNNGFNSGNMFIPLFISFYGIAWRISSNGFSVLVASIIFYLTALYFFFNVMVLGNSPGSV